MQTLVHDLRYALRQLRRAPGFALAATLTLALGIGATTAIFTLVYQVMLQALPVAHPEQLYKLGEQNQCCVHSRLQDHWSLFSSDLYRSLRDRTRGMEGMAAVQADATRASVRRAGDSGPAQPLDVRLVSGNYFSVLGVRPDAGRLLGEADDMESARPAVVVSYLLWKTQFAADPRLVGSTLTLSGHPVTVVGIADKAFTGERRTENPPGLWLCLAQEPMLAPEHPLGRFPTVYWLDVLLRIDKPAKVAQVQSGLQLELGQWIAAHPEVYEHASPQQVAQQTTELVRASEGINDLRDHYEKSLKLLLVITGLVLLIASANVAGLVLVRNLARAPQQALQRALGASRSRLVRQALLETLLLALLGGAVGVAVACVGTRALLALSPPGAGLAPVSALPSWPVLGFALVLSLVSGLVFGTVPAWVSVQVDPLQAMRGFSAEGKRAALTPQTWLVVSEAALSLVLLSTAGLLITSLRALEKQDFRFEPQARLLLFTDLAAAGYKVGQLPQLYRRFDDVLGRLPGVTSLAYATYSPMAHEQWDGGVFFPARSTTERNVVAYDAVSTGYFSALGTPILLGRSFSEHDDATSPNVAIVNRSFAGKNFPGVSPIGRRFGPSPAKSGEFEIVGVVGDTKYIDPAQPAAPMYYTSIAQRVQWTAQRDVGGENAKHFAGNLVLQYRGDQSAVAASLRKALFGIDAQIPIIRMVPYQDQLADNFTQQDVVVRLTSLFGLLALGLASIGLYGLTAYAVARRTSEIAIRMALGASRGGVLAMILRTALVQAGIGLAVGLPLSLVAGRLLQHTLYQTSSFQPLVLLAVMGLLLASALVAAWLPARRAASIDPMQALRAE